MNANGFNRLFNALITGFLNGKTGTNDTSAEEYKYLVDKQTLTNINGWVYWVTIYFMAY
jgi:hypothetical protein